MSNHNHTDEVLIAAMKLVAKHGGVAQAACAVGMNESTLRNRVFAARNRGLTAVSNPERNKDNEIKALKAQVAALEIEHDTAAKIRRDIYGLAERNPAPPAWLHTAGRAGSRGTPITMWSDWHYGEVVRKEEVGGVNEFNADVARRRIERLVDTTIDLCYNHMGKARTQYPGAIVCLGGDLISGDLHEDLRVTNDKTPQQCINDLTDYMASGLEAMASKFGKLYIPAVVGNHGRNTMKPRTKGVVFTSHEWNIYCNLERHFRSSKHVRFDISEHTDVHFQSYGHRYMLTHGDRLGVKGGDGIIGSIGPIMRGSIKVGRSEAYIGQDFDTVIMGHWHQHLSLPGIKVNNSLKGYDEFARNVLRAPYSRPSQQLWFTHPEHGITANWEVFLDKAYEPKTDKNWITWRE